MEEKIEKKMRVASDLLRGDRASEAERRSLALSMAALRRRKRRQRLIRWSLPATAAAALILAVALFFRPGSPPETARDPSPADSLVVRTHSEPEGMVVESQPSSGLAVSSRAIPAGVVASTGESRLQLAIVNSGRSSQLEFLSDRQLLAALEGRPVMLTETGDGDLRLVFLDVRDRHLLWEP